MSNNGVWYKQFRITTAQSCTNINSIHTLNILHEAEPNPAYGLATIRFGIQKDAHTTLTVFDVSGRIVAILLDEMLAGGTHLVKWEANVPPGVYFYRLQAGDFTNVKKMILLH